MLSSHSPPPSLSLRQPQAHSVQIACLGVSYKWPQTMCAFWYLASFSQPDAFEAHPVIVFIDLYSLAVSTN